MTKHQQPTVSKKFKFIYGGLSGCMATCFVQPIDLIKTRMQLAGEGGTVVGNKSTLSAARAVWVNEGIAGLYTGLTAALFRQVTYTATRMGVYMTLVDHFTEKNNGQSPTLLTLLGSGMAAGGIGAVVGTPAEVALIRMTSDGRLPVEQRRNYKNVFDSLLRITREEGFFTMWRGCLPTIARAMVLNAAQLATYSQMKKVLLATGKFEDGGLKLHLPAAIVSGFVCTCVSLPIDITKTRLQTMKTGQYAGAIDCVTQIVKKEGITAFWKGFTPYFSRLGPHTVLTFIFYAKAVEIFGHT